MNSSKLTRTISGLEGMKVGNEVNFQKNRAERQYTKTQLNFTDQKIEND